MALLEVTVQRKYEVGYPVVVEYSRPGELVQRGEGTLVLDAALLDELLAQQFVEPQGYGTNLGKALFQPAIRDLFKQALKENPEQLRVLLVVEDPQLQPLHWEWLCAPLQAGDGWSLLSLDQRTPFSRYLPSLTDRRYPAIGRRDLRALILVADPPQDNSYKLAPIDVAATVASIQQALGEIPHTVLARVKGAGGAPTLDALCEELTAQPYTLLHVVAHGGYDRSRGESWLYLLDGAGEIAPVAAQELLRRLGTLRRLPQLAYLAACESAAPEAERVTELGGLAQRLVRELGMPAVVAMTQRVSMATAQALATHFYLRLREHGQPDLALVEATVGLADARDVTVPALFSRLGQRSLFSDGLADRALTPGEIEHGLAQLAELLPVRAPVLQPRLDQLAQRVRGTLDVEEGTLTQELRDEREQALEDLDRLCQEVCDLSFAALALGKKPPPYDGRCPFMGMVAFKQADRPFFFGRDALVQALERKLVTSPFLAVLGPSGSGKSSLALAGLIPALQDKQPGLQLRYFTPTADPVAALAAALQGELTSTQTATSAPNIPAALGAAQMAPEMGTATPAAQATLTSSASYVLVADQFEELFTLCEDEAARRQFLTQLLALLPDASSPAQIEEDGRGNGLVGPMPKPQAIVLTMRADFWGDCAAYPALAALMERHQKLIAPMTPLELRGAMEQQASVVGLRFEADLAQTILEEVQEEPGAMPLLQHALLELWKRRHGRWLRGAEYRTMGGVRQAIARTADSIYLALGDPEQQLMRTILQRLTLVDASEAQADVRRDTRRRVQLDELIPAGEDAAVVRRLVNQLANEQARLLVTDEAQQVEVAHEALIRHWPRLQGWLDEDRAVLRLRQRLHDDVQAWRAAAPEEAEKLLPRWTTQLAVGLQAAQNPRYAFNQSEIDYLRAALALHEREEQAREAQRLRERRRRLFTAAVIGLAILLAPAIWLSNLAQESALAVSEAQRHAGEAIQLLDQDAAASIQTSLDTLPEPEGANARVYVPGAEFALHQAVRSSLERKYLRVIEPPLSVEHVAFSDRQIAVGHKGLYLVPDDLSQNGVVTLLHDVPGLLGVAWNDEMDALAVWSSDTVQVWLPTGQSFEPQFPGNELIRCAQWRPHAKQLAICRGASLWLWSYEEAESPLLLFEGADGGRIRNVAWSEDGRQFAAIEARTAWIGSVSMPQDVRSIDLGVTVDGVEFLDAQRFLIWNYREGEHAQLWSTSGERIYTFSTSWSALRDVALSPDKQTLLTLLVGGVIRVWDLETGEALRELHGHTNTALSIAWRGEYPDHPFIASFASDGTARVWNLDTGEEVVVLRGHAQARVGSRNGIAGQWHRDGQHILTAGEDGSIRLWRVFDDQGYPLCEGTAQCYGFSQRFLPPGPPIKIETAQWADPNTILAWSRDGGQAWRWRLSGPETGDGEPAILEQPLQGHNKVTWAPDGKWLFSCAQGSNPGVCSGDGVLREVGTQRTIIVAEPISFVEWLDIGLVVGQDSGNIHVFSMASGALVELPTLTGHNAQVASARAHGDWLATGALDGEIIVWDYKAGTRQFALSLPDGALGSQLPISWLQWNADGSYLLSSHGGDIVTLWDVEEQRSLKQWGNARAAAFSPDGRDVAVGVRHTFFIFDTQTRLSSGEVLAHDNLIQGIAWVEGSTWPNQDWGGPVAGSLLRMLLGKPWRTPATRLLLLTWGDDRTVRLWADVDTSAVEIARLPSGAEIRNAAVNDDGSRLLALDADGMLRVWQMWLKTPGQLRETAGSLVTRLPADE